MRILTRRAGPRPSTTSTIPHSQTNQQPESRRLMDAVLDAALTWPGVTEAESQISVEGARALVLAPQLATGPSESFITGSEFAHGHANGDYSFHAALPRDLALRAQESGWAEPHLLVASGQVPPTLVMLYAPRDDHEADILLDLVRSSYQFTTGTYLSE
ncbi:luciferase family protein [Gordonia sp. VNK1]|uniref:luciferase domain-containing protein n=1 Tax=Gordonia oleivorans TaxID=3156618 RepID=UPI0032B52666